MRTTRWPRLFLLLSFALCAAPLLLTGCDDPVEDHADLGGDAGVPDLLKPDLRPIVDPDMGGHD